MVRLRATQHLIRLAYFSFQFQYGAIKRLLKDSIALAALVFQFQYGAIKRAAFPEITADFLSFNSNMVRLREES